MELRYPDLDTRAIDLTDATPLVRGGKPGTLAGRLRFGGPLAAPLGADDVKDDPDLDTFINREATTWRFVLIHSALSFHSAPDESELETASVEMRLTGADDQSSVTSWSLSPPSAATPFEASRSFKLSPEAKILGVDFSIGDIEIGKTRHGEDAFLLATGLLTAEPTWQFKHTATVRLEGSYRLAIVARAPAGAPAQLTTTLSASVKTGFGPRRFRKTVELAGGEHPTAELSF